MTHVEVVPAASVLGRVRAVERSGRAWRLDTWAARWRARVIVVASPALARVLPPALGLRRVWSGGAPWMSSPSRSAACARPSSTHHPEVADVVARRYEGFLSSGPADWRIEAGVRPEGVVALEDVVVRPAGGSRRLEVERHDFLATLDLDRRTGTLQRGPSTTSRSTRSCA